MLTCSSFVELRGFAARARDPLEVVLDLGEDVLFDELEAGPDVDSHLAVRERRMIGQPADRRSRPGGGRG